MIRENRVPKTTIKKIGAIALAAFALFSAGPTVQQSVEAWPKVFDALTPGGAQDADSTPARSDDRGER